MALGQAAGTAAHLALASLSRPTTRVPRPVSVRTIPIDQLQRLLLKHGQVIAFFHDLPPAGTEEFEAVQFFAVRSFFDTYDVLRWLAALLKCPADEILNRIRIDNFRPDAPLTRGQICVWLYRLWWSVRSQ
jgi:hypothetical protein